MKPNRKRGALSERAQARVRARKYTEVPTVSEPPVSEPLECRIFLSAGALDTSFGNGGLATVPFEAQASTPAQRILVQPDGKTVVAGTYGNVYFSDLFLTRYDTDGGLDPTFGNGGIDIVPDSSVDVVEGFALQPDGKFIVVTSGSSGAVVSRFDVNGSLDTSFSTGVDQLLDAFIPDSIALQADGKVVVAGATVARQTGNATPAIVRLNSDGSVDATFGSAGIATDEVLPEPFVQFNDVIIDSNGKLLVTGTAVSHTGARQIGVARFDDDGSLDTTFGEGGISATLAGDGVALTLDGAGNLVVASETGAGQTSPVISVERLDPAGGLDTTFGNGGLVSFNGVGTVGIGTTTTGQIMLSWPGSLIRLTSSGVLDSSYDGSGSAAQPPYQTNVFAFTPDGSATGAGQASSGALFVAHFLASGTLDGGFGGTGYVVTPVLAPTESQANAIELQSDGKIVAATSVFATGPTVIRLNADGALDTTFGTDGIVTLSKSVGSAASILVEPDGDIVVGAGIGGTAAIFRLLPNGQLDPSFGNGGEVVLSQIPTSAEFVIGTPLVSERPDGRIVAEVQTESARLPEFAATLVVQFTASGQIDTTFGQSGIAALPGIFDFTIPQIRLDGNGRIDLVGTSSSHQFILARLTPTGELDSSFGGGQGYVVTAFPTVGPDSEGDAITIQNDQKIVVAGISASFAEPATVAAETSSYATDVVLARYNDDGSPDTTFGDSGASILTLPGQFDFVAALQSLGDRSLVLSGTEESGVTDAFYVARLNSDGSLDTRFADNGVAAVQLGEPGGISSATVRPNGNIVVAGSINPPPDDTPTFAVAEFVGLPPNVIAGTHGADQITLSQDPDHHNIDWSLNGGPTYVMPINDPNGLTINGDGGNDVITLDYSNGNPLPAILHLNGTFTINGLQGANPLAGRTLDIGTSTVYISYADIADDPIFAIRGYLQAGYNPGPADIPWSGTPTALSGVVTSAAAENDRAHTAAISYADFADGQGIDTVPNTIELKYTLAGDANLDGQVNSADLQVLLFGLDRPGSWDQGDFNYDGQVNSADLQMLLATLNTTLDSQATPLAVAATPAANTTTSAPGSSSRTSTDLVQAINSTGSTTTPSQHLNPAKTTAKKRK